MILCRYTTSERCIELIKDQRLYAANPVVDFNDPFEFCLGTVGEINREDMDRHYRNNLRPRLSADLQKKLPEDLTNEAWETLKPTYKQKRKQDNEESIKDAVEKTIRIICFCDPDKIKNGGEDILLWSHYANGRQPAADAFLESIEANPQFRFVGAIHWLVSNCYEKLKAAEEASAQDADPVIIDL